MKNIIRVWCLAVLWMGYFTPANAQDNIFEILKTISKMYGVNLDSFKKLKKINDMTLQELHAITGKHHVGKEGYQDFQSWGDSHAKWDSALVGYKEGQGSIGHLQKKFDTQFPIAPNYKQLDLAKMHVEFDTLQAQTALASRAASQDIFDRIQKQIAYQQTLQTQIDETTDLKTATDLQNRLLFENNMIALDTLRLMAISAQQQSIQLQASANEVTSNKAFVSDIVE